MPDEESISGATIAATNNGQDAESPNLEGPQHCEGYQKLADMMSEYPAGAVFRQFGPLNHLNLLYYQAELCLLEKQLRIAAEQDRQSPDQFRRLYFQNHQYLSRGKAEGSNLKPEDNLQWKTVLRIREVLKEYSMQIHPSHQSRDVDHEQTMRS